MQERARCAGRGLSCARDGCNGADRSLLHILEIKAGDSLPFAVFVEGEIFFFEVAKGVAFFVAGHDIYEHQFGGDLNAILIVGGLIGILSGEREKWREQSRGREQAEYFSDVVRGHVIQKRKRACSVMRRMLLTLVTSPKVNEFTTELMEA